MMIRCIAAIDTKHGIADDHGIPWLYRIPTDTQFYRDQTKTGLILMGYGTYIEFDKPFHGRDNYVATTSTEPLKKGFVAVSDVAAFLKNAPDDVWIIGGAGLFASTLDFADELYITQLDKDFRCTKFFPEFKDQFVLKTESPPQTENGITFTFQVWTKR